MCEFWVQVQKSHLLKNEMKYTVQLHLSVSSIHVAYLSFYRAIAYLWNCDILSEPTNFQSWLITATQGQLRRFNLLSHVELRRHYNISRSRQLRQFHNAGRKTNIKAQNFFLISQILQSAMRLPKRPPVSRLLVQKTLRTNMTPRVRAIVDYTNSLISAFLIVSFYQPCSQSNSPETRC